MKKQETSISETLITTFAIACSFTLVVIIVSILIWSLEIPLGLKVLFLIIDMCGGCVGAMLTVNHMYNSGIDL